MKVLGYDSFDESRVTGTLKKVWTSVVMVCLALGTVISIYTDFAVFDDFSWFITTVSQTSIVIVCITRLTMLLYYKGEIKQLMLDLKELSSLRKF